MGRKPSSACLSLSSSSPSISSDLPSTATSNDRSVVVDMAAEQGVLRRWKRFLPVFASIDAAIEAADPGICREEFRGARSKILKMLGDATDDEVVEKLCVVLDEVMIESLLTLKLVPAMPTMLSSTDLAKDIGALMKHESARVRGLATVIVHGWKASVKSELDKAASAMAKLSQVLQPEEPDEHAKILEPSAAKTTAKALVPSLPKTQSAPLVFCGDRAKTAKMELPPENVSLVVRSFRREGLERPSSVAPAVDRSCYTDEKALNAAKRKLREGYQEAEDAKRQRMIQVIQAPSMAKQQQRKMHPILKLRSRSSCATSTAKRTSFVSSHRMA
ncbi:hypothetical protein ABZP36_011762 [Zizania latifolia]